MARKNAEDNQAMDENSGGAGGVENTSNVQADRNSIAINRITIAGDVGGSFTIGHTIGYTAEQVSTLLTQITSVFQPKPFDGSCPFKGLDVFEEEDAELFFGRERLVEELVSRVKESRAVFITGPSGSGKSSLVRAGLLPALKQGAIKELNSERWLYETMKPGREPLKDVALAFSRLKGPDLADYLQVHANEMDVLNKCAESVLSGRKDQRFVLFVDQFEEVFTQINQEGERVAFLNMLAHAGTVENGRVIVLFAMRSDFVSNCATYSALNELLSQQFRQVGAMQPEELVSAIALPAKQVGLPIEDELIARIINDMRGEPGALPLMQFALKDLFDSQQEKGGVIALTLKDYLQHGGIHKSLERHADNSLAQLSESEQQLARSIFRGLIEIGRGTQDTRRTVLFDELVPANADSTDVEAVIQKLADARLIITDEQAGQDTVTISHEKLIDAWPWLKKLVNENREVIALQNEIASDAKEWADHKRDASYLYSGTRLVRANEQLRSNKLVLSGTAFEYIRAGQTRQQLRQISLIGGISIIFALLVTAVIIFANLTKVANKQADIALARQLAAQAQTINRTRSSKQMTAALLAIRSMQLFPTVDASQILQNNTLVQPLLHLGNGDKVTVVIFSPDGKYIVIGNFEKGIIVEDAITGKEMSRMSIRGVNSLALSLDSKYVVAGSYDGTAHVWETFTGIEIAHMMAQEKYVNSVTFSPNGKYVASAGCDKTDEKNPWCTQGSARVWDTTSGREIARMTYDGPVKSVAFSPDNNYVVSGACEKYHAEESGICGASTAQVWKASTGQEISRMTHDDGVNSVAFSPDGKYVVSGSWDDTVRVWEAAIGKEITQMIHDSAVQMVAFSPDGKYVVSGSNDNTSRVWETATGKEIARMAHDDAVYVVAFSPDGKYVVSGSWDGTARVWEANTGNEVARMTHDDTVDFVAFSPDGRYVVSGDQSGAAYVWDTTTKEFAATDLSQRPHVSIQCEKYNSTNSTTNSNCIQTFVAMYDPSTNTQTWGISIAGPVIHPNYSLDGKYLAFADRQNTIHVWETATGKEIAHMTHDKEVLIVTISPDGSYVASGSQDGTARIWEIATGKEISRITYDDLVDKLAFSPDGRYIVVAGYYGETARVCEVTTGKELARMTHNDGVVSVAFSPDGNYVVSGSRDKTVIVWEATTEKEVAHMTYDNDFAYGVVFSPDGKYVQSPYPYEKLVWLWRAEDLIAEACSRVRRNLTPEEWKLYLGDEPYQGVCPNLPIESEHPPTPTRKPIRITPSS